MNPLLSEYQTDHLKWHYPEQLIEYNLVVEYDKKVNRLYRYFWSELYYLQPFERYDIDYDSIVAVNLTTFTPPSSYFLETQFQAPICLSLFQDQMKTDIGTSHLYFDRKEVILDYLTFRLPRISILISDSFEERFLTYFDEKSTFYFVSDDIDNMKKVSKLIYDNFDKIYIYKLVSLPGYYTIIGKGVKNSSCSEINCKTFINWIEYKYQELKSLINYSVISRNNLESYLISPSNKFTFAYDDLDFPFCRKMTGEEIIQDNSYLDKAPYLLFQDEILEQIWDIWKLNKNKLLVLINMMKNLLTDIEIYLFIVDLILPKKIGSFIQVLKKIDSSGINKEDVRLYSDNNFLTLKALVVLFKYQIDEENYNIEI
jgi:hypothetical protein